MDEGCAGGEVRYGYFRLSEDRCIRVICTIMEGQDRLVDLIVDTRSYRLSERGRRMARMDYVVFLLRKSASGSVGRWPGGGRKSSM